jgi:hypothetical protein
MRGISGADVVCEDLPIGKCGKAGEPIWRANPNGFGKSEWGFNGGLQFLEKCGARGLISLGEGDSEFRGRAESDCDAVPAAPFFAAGFFNVNDRGKWDFAIADVIPGVGIGDVKCPGS